MSRFELFPDNKKVGVFRGFRDAGMEFHADLTLPFRPEFQNRPMHGGFVLVELDKPDEAILGRIAALSSDGKLSAGSGEEYNIRALQENRPVPADIRKRYLRYRVNIRVLGVLKSSEQGVSFVASLRRLPPAGSAVAFPSGPVLQEITGHRVDGATIGHLALGEYFYGPADEATEDWMQAQPEHARVNFAVENLVARRSFIFARAGFGKSNLTKLLFSSLYATTPTVTKRRRTPSAGGHGHLRSRRRVLLARRQGPSRLLRCRRHGRAIGGVHVAQGSEPLLRILRRRQDPARHPSAVRRRCRRDVPAAGPPATAERPSRCAA